MTARKRRKPKVFYHYGDAARIGPLGYWEVGDRVTVPGRGPKLGDAGLQGFDGVVTTVDPGDGMASVRPVTEEEASGGEG